MEPVPGRGSEPVRTRKTLRVALFSTAIAILGNLALEYFAASTHAAVVGAIARAWSAAGRGLSAKAPWWAVALLTAPAYVWLWLRSRPTRSREQSLAAPADPSPPEQQAPLILVAVQDPHTLFWDSNGRLVANGIWSARPRNERERVVIVRAAARPKGDQAWRPAEFAFAVSPWHFNEPSQLRSHVTIAFDPRLRVAFATDAPISPGEFLEAELLLTDALGREQRVEARYGPCPKRKGEK